LIIKKENDKMSFTVKTEISNQRIQDLLCCALEGGSNYWCRQHSFRYPEGKGKDDYTYRHLEVALDGGIQLLVEDCDVFGEVAITHELTREVIQAGLELFSKFEPKSHFDNFINENEDAETGDVFLQLCLFNEIRYG